MLNPKVQIIRNLDKKFLAISSFKMSSESHWDTRKNWLWNQSLALPSTNSILDFFGAFFSPIKLEKIESTGFLQGSWVNLIKKKKKGIWEHLEK